MKEEHTRQEKNTVENESCERIGKKRTRVMIAYREMLIIFKFEIRY